MHSKNQRSSFADKHLTYLYDPILGVLMHYRNARARAVWSLLLKASFRWPLNSWTCRMAGSRHRSAHKPNLFSSWMPDHGRSCPTWTCPPEHFCPNRFHHDYNRLCCPNALCLEVFGYETMWGTRTACAGGSAEANEIWLDASRTCQKYPKDFKRCFATHCCAISKGSTWFGWTLVGYDVYSFDFFWQVWLVFVYFPCQGLHYVATMFDHSHSWDDHDYHDIRNDFLPLLNPLPILENCELGFEPEKGHCCSDLFSQIVSQKCFFRKDNI